MTGRILLLAIFLLAGCGPQDNDPGPGGVTVGEARALDEAAEMLERQRLPEGALGGAAERSDQIDPTPTPSPSPAG